MTAALPLSPPTSVPAATAGPEPTAYPGRLGAADLAELTRQVAADVRAVRHRVHYDAHTRWHVRLFRSEWVDVWLISWLPSQGTQLHDHGGSAGAFTVVSGALVESVWNGRGLDDRHRRTDETVTFDEHRVHDVRNQSDQPAVSVHAYSAPLSSMRFYDLDNGALDPFGTLVTDDPEPDPATVQLRLAR